MKRQRIIGGNTVSARMAASPVTSRPVLRSSTRLNQTRPAIATSMSYKELIKVVGVDCEMSPSYWRKSIDHSAETVVFFQVDLRGNIPRMSKSVRICRQEGTNGSLVPSVFVGETLLSSTYVKTIIGRKFLADEDDLMKLLEHAGILHEDEEIVQEQDDQDMADEWDGEATENDPVCVEPMSKKAKMGAEEKSQVVSHSGMQQPSTRRRARSVALPQETAHPVHSDRRRPPIDLSPMILITRGEEMAPASFSPSVSTAEDDTAMEAEFDATGLPADDGNDDWPLGDDLDDTADQLQTGQGSSYSRPPADVDEEEKIPQDSVKEPVLRKVKKPLDTETAFSDEAIGILIDAVQANPVLWTRGTDPVKRKLAWEGVVALFNQQVGDPPAARTMEQCVRKWHHLMQTFRRILRTKNKDGKLMTNWKWTEKLLFAASSYKSKGPNIFASGMKSFQSSDGGEWRIVRERNPRIIRSTISGNYKYSHYWQKKAVGTVQLRHPYDIYVYKTILDDIGVRYPPDDPDNASRYQWQLIQHLMGGEDGIVASYENRMGRTGFDRFMGPDTVQIVHSYGIADNLHGAPRKGKDKTRGISQEQKDLALACRAQLRTKSKEKTELYPGSGVYLPKGQFANFQANVKPKNALLNGVNLAVMFFRNTETAARIFRGDHYGIKAALGPELLNELMAYINGYHPGAKEGKIKEADLIAAFSRKLYYIRRMMAKEGEKSQRASTPDE